MVLESVLGQILVRRGPCRCSAAGFGPWDSRIRAGKSALPQPLFLLRSALICPEQSRPRDPAFEMAIGDQVFGVITDPALREYAVVPGCSREENQAR